MSGPSLMAATKRAAVSQRTPAARSSSRRHPHARSGHLSNSTPPTVHCRRQWPCAARAQAQAQLRIAVPEPAMHTQRPAERPQNEFPGLASHDCISPLNADIPPARPGEFAPLRLGPDIAVWPPVGLAPMAGITNAPFRAMCAAAGAPLCISEMLAAGPLNEGHARTRAMARFFPGESPRSVQLYGVDPAQVRQAAAWLAQGAGAQHIDLNFGCPVRKVTAKGGGAAIPARPRLLAQLVAAAVAGAGSAAVVTVKFRTGISDAIQTFLEAGRVSEAEGAAAVSLHARTCQQLYDPPADWSAIARLVAALSIPVLGNGDVFEAGDALRMMRQTGAAGVLVGRGCLGRPWLFAELHDAFEGRAPRPPPDLSGALAAADAHLRSLVDWEGGKELATLRAMRKMVPLYLHGFGSAIELRQRLLMADSLAAWDTAIATGDHNPHEPFPAASLRHARLKGVVHANRQKVALPPGWLDDQQLDKRPLPGAGVSCEG